MPESRADESADPILAITRWYAGILSFVWVFLMVGVIAIRVTNGVKIGDGGIPTLATRIRGHANFVETAPYFLIILAMNELADEIPSYWINSFASCFIFGRVVHAIGFFFEEPSTPARIIGAFGAIIPISALSLYGMLGWKTSSHIVVTSFQVFGSIVRFVLIPMLKPMPVKWDDNKKQ